MLNARRRLIPIAILVVGAACAITAAGGSATVSLRATSTAGAAAPCGLRLGRPQRGELLFRTPAGGRAVRRALVGRFALCTLLRRDGSRFALLHSDADAACPRGGVLSALRDAVERRRLLLRRGSAGPGEREVRQLLPGVDRQRLLEEGEEMVDRRDRRRESTATQSCRRSGTRRANGRTTSTGAASRTRRNRPRPSRARRRSRPSTTARASSTGAASRTTRTATARSRAPSRAYDNNGTPIESDIRFNTAFTWSTKGAAGAFDIQSAAAHEIGHILQFDHVTNRRSTTTRRSCGRTSAPETNPAASSAAATRSRTTATTKTSGPRSAAQD